MDLPTAEAAQPGTDSGVGGNSVPNTPPSFYGASATEGTGSIGNSAAANAFRNRPASDNTTPLRWGPFTAHPHLSYAFTYGTGVLFQPGAPTSTALHTVSPGLTILSRHLVFDYSPSLNYYSKGPYEDAVNHSATLSASFGYKDWTFSIQQSYSEISQPLIETARQTETEFLSTALTAHWAYSEKVFFDFTLSQQFQDAQDLQSSRNWSTMDWINYKLTRHLSVGGGVGAGYTDMDFGSDSTYEQLQGRLNWNPSLRLSVNLNGGIEIRQFLGSAESGNLVNPIMGAAVNYQLFEPTSLFLSANRSVNSSLFANQIDETTRLSAGVSQRLLGRLSLGVSGGYRTTDYKNVSAAANNRRFLEVDRSDDSTFISTSLGAGFLKRGYVSLAYEHSKNDSSIAGFTYDSDQFTAQVSYRF